MVVTSDEPRRDQPTGEERLPGGSENGKPRAIPEQVEESVSLPVRYREAPAANPSAQEASSLLMRALEDAGAITPTALLIHEPEIEYDRYEALCYFLGRLNRSCSWWIGDLLNYGEQVFGHYVYQAAEATGLAPQTLANRASVCRHIPPSRRRASLPFGVHAEVAYLDPAERDRWLDRAELGGWTRATLRDAMRAARGIESGSVGDLTVTSKNEDDDMSDLREEHSVEGVPAAKRDFLGELVRGQIHTCPSCGHTFQ